ncbi:MAG TPA: hypothetical protein PK472_16945 [Pseudomonadota bacterium]|nr:hypothetical protein [Pseudomonadota bacterium]
MSKKSTPKPQETTSSHQPPTAAHALVPATDPESAYSLPQLLKRTGGAKPEEVRKLIAVPDADLIAAGKQVATPRVSIDCARLYGQALDVFSHATAAQKAALLGISQNLLRIAIFSAHHGDELYSARQLANTQEKNLQSSRRHASETALSFGQARRDQLKLLLLSVTGDEPGWKKRIVAAYGSAKEPADLAQALRSLSTLTQEVIDSKDPQIVARRGDSGLDKPLLSALSQLADDISALGSLGDAARAVAKVSQGEVDLWDGINLVLLERIIGLFQVAHELEPSIPLLRPISLYRQFYGYRNRAPEMPPTPPAS